MSVWKVWYSNGANSRDSHAGQEGERVEIEDIFSNGCIAPGSCDSGGEAANCQCSIEIEVDAHTSRDGGFLGSLLGLIAVDRSRSDSLREEVQTFLDQENLND